MPEIDYPEAGLESRLHHRLRSVWNKYATVLFAKIKLKWPLAPVVRVPPFLQIDFILCHKQLGQGISGFSSGSLILNPERCNLIIY